MTVVDAVAVASPGEGSATVVAYLTRLIRSDAPGGRFSRLCPIPFRWVLYVGPRSCLPYWESVAAGKGPWWTRRTYRPQRRRFLLPAFRISFGEVPQLHYL